MTVEYKSEKRIICSNPDSPFRYFGWPSVTRLPDGNLAMVCSGFRLKHICPFGKAVICYSRDEGRTWTNPAVVIDTPLDDRDGGILTFGNRVMVTSFNNRMKFQREVCGWKGEHSPASDLQAKLICAYADYVGGSFREDDYLGSTYRISDDGGYTFGPLKRSPVTCPHGPVATSEGKVLYIGRKFSDDQPGNTQIQCFVLNGNDEPEYYSCIEDVDDGRGRLNCCEPHTVILPDGKIIVHIRVERGAPRSFTVYQSESLDGGKTFSSPRRLLDECGGSPAHLMYHSSGVLVSVYGYRNSPFGQRVMFSRDEGETWSTDWILDDTGRSGDLGYPASVELKDGSILTVYYENIGDQSVIMQQIWRIPENI